MLRRWRNVSDIAMLTERGSEICNSAFINTVCEPDSFFCGIVYQLSSGIIIRRPWLRLQSFDNRFGLSGSKRPVAVASALRSLHSFLY